MYFNKIHLNLPLVLLGVSSCAIPVVFGQVDQSLRLYEQFDSQGMYIDVTRYEPDLGKIGFDNRTRSVCLLGSWIFYTELNYAYLNYNSHGFLAGTTSTTRPFCLDLQENVTAGYVSSVRFVGSPGFPVDTFNLYEYRTWMGEEEYFTNDQPNLRLKERHASIVITGSSNWTVFEGTNYTGPRICLVPDSIYDISRVGIRHGALRSARKGCDLNSPAVNTRQAKQIDDMNGTIIKILNVD